MDFVHDQPALGNKLRILTIVDTHSRLPGGRPALHLPRRGFGPDIGTGLCPDRLSEDDPGRQYLWAYADGVTLDFARPGKPTDDGFIKAFNSKLRSECLNAHWLMSLVDAQ